MTKGVPIARPSALLASPNPFRDPLNLGTLANSGLLLTNSLPLST